MLDPERSRQLFLPQYRNVLAGATPTGASVTDIGSQHVVFPSRPRRGGDGQGRSTGSVVIEGSYAVDGDTEIEAEISGGSGATRRASAVFSGAGNGTATGVTADNAVAIQKIVWRLISLGIDTERATFNLGGIQFRARPAYEGDLGNNIRAEVNPDAVIAATRAAPIATTPADVAADQVSLEEPGWRFTDNIFPLSSSGQIHVATARIAFDQYANTVYRQYIVRHGARDIVFIDPPISEPVKKGATVYLVNDAYTLELYDVTDQAGTLETYTGITVFDFASQLLASKMIEPIVSILENRRPGGVAAVDLNDRTTGYLRTNTGEGSQYATGFNDFSSVTIDRTETLTATAWAVHPSQDLRAALGKELWHLSSSIDGVKLPMVVSGQTVAVSEALGVYAATIIDPADAVGVDERMRMVVPQKFPIGYEAQTPTVELKKVNYSTSTGLNPEITLIESCIGSNLVPQTLTLTYEARPKDADDCGEPDIRGTIDDACVNCITPATDESYAAQLPSILEQLARLQTNTKIVVRVYFHVSGGLKRYQDYDTESAASSAAVTFLQAYGGATYTGATPGIGDTISLATASSGGQQQATIYILNQTVADTTDPLYEGAVVVIEYMDYLLKAVVKGNAAKTLWDSKWAALILQIDGVLANTVDGTVPVFVDACRADFKEIIDASVAAGAVLGDDECWDDPGDTTWWVIESEYGNLKPLFSNHRNPLVFEDGTPTFWGQFVIRIPCASDVNVGTSLTIDLGEASPEATYQKGDKLILELAGGRPLSMQGGVTGNDTYTYAQVESGDGLVRPNYEVVNGAEQSYQGTLANAANANGLDFTLKKGTQPNQLQDTWTLIVEGGQVVVRHRLTGEPTFATIGPQDISPNPINLPIFDGVSLRLVDNADISFEPQDLFVFEARHPDKSANMLVPTWDAFRPAGGVASITIPIENAPQPVSFLSIPWSHIPAGRIVTMSILDVADAVLFTTPEMYSEDVMFADVEDTLDAHSIRIDIDDATDVAIYWVWAGEPIQLSYDADQISVQRARGVARGQGLNVGALPQGRGWQAEIAWSWDNNSTGPLSSADIAILRELYDKQHAANEAPIAFIPNYLVPFGMLGRWQQDQFEINDDLAFNANPGELVQQIASMSLAPFLNRI